MYLYLILIGPCFLLAIYAQNKVKATFEKYNKLPAGSGMTGAEAAAAMLRDAGLAGKVSIERVKGFLADHYDPRTKILRLSPAVHDGRSLSAVGVACHEAGHAVQDAKHYAPLALRNAIVPTAALGSRLAMPLIMIGVIISILLKTPFGFYLAVGGLILFAMAVVFQLINLPVEFNASARAKRMLPRLGIIQGQKQVRGVASVLDAAALTYIAATITAAVQLIYYAMMIFGGRRG